MWQRPTHHQLQLLFQRVCTSLNIALQKTKKNKNKNPQKKTTTCIKIIVLQWKPTKRTLWNRDNLYTVENSKAPIYFVVQLIDHRSISLKVDPSNYEQQTKAGAASNKSIESGPLRRDESHTSTHFVKPRPSRFVKLNEQKSRIKIHTLNEAKWGSSQCWILVPTAGKYIISRKKPSILFTVLQQNSLLISLCKITQKLLFFSKKKTKKNNQKKTNKVGMPVEAWNRAWTLS